MSIDETVKLNLQISDLKAKLSTAVDALEKYGQHENWCALEFDTLGTDLIQIHPCSCGYDEALKLRKEG